MYFGRLIFTVLAVSLLAVTQASAKSKQMECFQGFSQCMRENKGEIKMCSDRRSACMKGDKKSTRKPRKRAKKRSKPSPMECSKKYMGCMREKNGDRKFCKGLRKRCLNGELEEEVKEVKKEAVKKKVKKKRRKKKGKATKRKLRGNTGAKDSPCWTINMAMENCRGHAKKGCKGYNGSFDNENDCTRCLNEHRMPMKLHQPMIFSSRDKIKKCKKHKKDLPKLKACMKTIKNRNDRFQTKKYYEAQVEVDKAIAAAKDSGIKGCGDFTRMH